MYSELTSVELPLIKTLVRLGWKFVSAKQMEAKDRMPHDYWVDTEIINKIQALNPTLTENNAKIILKKLKGLEDDESFYQWLIGDETHKPSADSKSISVKLFDFDNLANNSFWVTNQYSTIVTHPDNAEKHIRPDVVLLVNGFPLTIIECKTLSTNKSTWVEGIQQIERYQRTSPKLFICNVFNITTDGFIFKYGATRAPQKFYMEWKHEEVKEIEAADSEFNLFAIEQGKAYNPFIDQQIYNLLNRATFMDVVQNFIVYETEDNTTIKKVCRYQQYRATNKILQRVLKKDLHSGLIWHTQGSGKSLTMLFTAKKIRNTDALNNPTVLVVVDRIDLDTQISGTFAAVKMKNTARASSASVLKKKLKEGSREIIITTVFKFQDIKSALDDRDNIIVLIDEAHRTQEGDVAANLRAALPNAFLFGFTGTPIDKSTRNTHRNFGLKGESVERYLDLYNIRNAINDKATVPVHYMLRNKRWFLKHDQLDKIIDNEFSDLDAAERDHLKEKASRFETFMLKPERLESIADDLTHHFNSSIRPKGFKAQLVCYNRLACVRMKALLDERLGEAASSVIFSSGQNDKLELKEHTKSKQQIKTEISNFKKKEHPLQILIVQNMLLTGFDAPIEQVMYLDRPLKDHNLLQAIARTNRPYPNKKCGIIVDYCGVLNNLKDALNFDESEVADSLYDFEQLKLELPEQIQRFKDIFDGVYINNIQQTIIHIIDNQLNDEVKEAFKAVQLTYETLSPDPFIVPYQKDYQWMTKLTMALSAFESQSKPNIDEYLPFTKELIQKSLDLREVNEAVPVFKVDENYLQNLENTKVSKEMKEITLEQRMRSVLRIKMDELPIYKTLMERLEAIINRKNELGENLFSELSRLQNQYLEAKKQDELSGESKGLRAIKQVLEKKVSSADLLEKMANDLDDIVKKHTEGLKEWTNQDSIKGNIKMQIIVYLAQQSSKADVNIQSDELSDYSKELLQYIETHY